MIVKTYYTTHGGLMTNWVETHVDKEYVKKMLFLIAPNITITNVYVTSQGWADGYQVVAADIYFDSEANNIYRVTSDIGRDKLYGKPICEVWGIELPSGGLIRWDGNNPQKPRIEKGLNCKVLEEGEETKRYWFENEFNVLEVLGNSIAQLTKTFWTDHSKPFRLQLNTDNKIILIESDHFLNAD